jgi:hypothetical protein
VVHLVALVVGCALKFVHEVCTEIQIDQLPVHTTLTHSENIAVVGILVVGNFPVLVVLNELVLNILAVGGHVANTLEELDILVVVGGLVSEDILVVDTLVVDILFVGTLAVVGHVVDTLVVGIRVVMDVPAVVGILAEVDNLVFEDILAAVDIYFVAGSPGVDHVHVVVDILVEVYCVDWLMDMILVFVLKDVLKK